jgi:hypothetical protein
MSTFMRASFAVLRAAAFAGIAFAVLLPACAPTKPAASPSPSAAPTPASAPPPTTAVPEGWFMSGGDAGEYASSFDPSVKHDGSGSIRLAAKSSSPTGYGTLMRQDPALPHHERHVRVSAFVKGENIGARGDLWVRVQEPNSPGEGPGTRYEVVLDVAPDAVDIAFGLLLTSGGKTWIDDAKLETVSTGVPTTDRHPHSAGNLDFER